MRGNLLLICISVALVAFGSMTNLVFAQESISWKSDYRIGILNFESNSTLAVNVSTFSKDSLQLEWQEPDTAKDQKIIGYEILRKDLNSDYRSIVENTNSKNISYVDKNLNEGYYAYKIIPVVQQIEHDKITMHGIDRYHSLFPIYLKFQQQLAEYTLKQTCHKCFDEPFEEIDNIFRYE